MKRIQIKLKIPDFILLERCGRGGSSEVWRGIDLNGIQRAIRIVPKDPEGWAAAEYRCVSFYREQIGIHENLLDYLYIGETVCCYYYIMPLADRVQTKLFRYKPDTLLRRIRRHLEPVEIFPYIRAILDGISYLHEHGISHNDLKPENILFVRGTLKLIDPGLSNGCTHYTNGGTPGFRPPWNANGTETDIYSFGKIIYCLMTGNDPFKFPELPEELELKKMADLNAIALRCCDADPAERYQTIAEIQRDLDAAFADHTRKSLHGQN